MSKWRKSGIDIPNIRKTPIGTIVMKKVHGVPREYIMTENGLKRRNPTKVIGVNKARIAAKKKKAARVRADNKKTVIITTVKEVKVIKPPKRKSVNPCNHGKPPKPEPKPHREIVPFNPAIHMMVKIDNKTYKQVLKTAV